MDMQRCSSKAGEEDIEPALWPDHGTETKPG